MRNLAIVAGATLIGLAVFTAGAYISVGETPMVTRSFQLLGVLAWAFFINFVVVGRNP